MSKTESMQVAVAQQLLQINAIKIQPSNPFTWASGWKSPIYCDNRKILSFPEVRRFIRDCFAGVITSLYPDAEVIAGVATGAIAHGALVAEKLGLPFIYVRSQPKGHGLENLIEGVLQAGQKVVVVEDLVSTGGSSLKAAASVSANGGEVLGMTAVFSYQFPAAIENFSRAGIALTTLSCYQTLIGEALASGAVTREEHESLLQWREDPAGWGRG